MKRNPIHILIPSLLLLMGTSGRAEVVLFEDDFNAGVFDQNKWEFALSSGNTMVVENGKAKASFYGGNPPKYCYAVTEPLMLPKNWTTLTIAGTWGYGSGTTGEAIVKTYEDLNETGNFYWCGYAAWQGPRFRYDDSCHAVAEYNDSSFPAQMTPFCFTIQRDSWWFTNNAIEKLSLDCDAFDGVDVIRFKMGGWDASALLNVWYFDDIRITVENSDDFAYGENIGWIDFYPYTGEPDVGMDVNDSAVCGFIWSENVGWINLNPESNDPNIGIRNDGTGVLTGFAWGENIGWIDFNPQQPNDSSHVGVTIDQDGHFDGWAWGENVGWIHLRDVQPIEYGVTTNWSTSFYVDIDDLHEFSDCWLTPDEGINADLDSDGSVDLEDFSILAERWLEKVPPGWPLGID